jgi:hypothetical protein
LNRKVRTPALVIGAREDRKEENDMEKKKSFA